MIDCSRTENYFVEKKRMTKINEFCQIDCVDCPLDSSNSGIDIPCKSLEANYPDKAIKIVQIVMNGSNLWKTLVEKQLEIKHKQNGINDVCV